MTNDEQHMMDNEVDGNTEMVHISFFIGFLPIRVTHKPPQTTAGAGWPRGIGQGISLHVGHWQDSPSTLRCFLIN